MDSVVLPELPATDSIPTNVIRPPELTPLPIPRPASPNWPRVRGYEVHSIIGAGGMGVVYKARHRNLGRTVALKMLRGTTLADPDVYSRFKAEAEAVARLQHPNIIQVFEFGTVDPAVGEIHPSPFMSLEFVEGGSLTRYTDRPQSPRFAAEMVEKLARAVHSAHRLGVVHRDLKPANVLLTTEGEPKIADFGVAKQLGAERDAGGRFMTQAGTVLGTPEYMAPEQAAGNAPTEALDIYALGVILYHLLTARVPFQGATPAETMTLAQLQDPVSPRRLQPTLPRDLETICLKCLEKEPGKRYGSAAALADDLRRFLGGQTIQARRVRDVEKALRWCRRNPLAAACLAGVIGTFLVAFALVFWSYLRVETALHQEAQQRHAAERKEKAERWERYRANIVATASALQVHNVGSARGTLEDTPEEYRNWEWRHFHSRLDLAQQVLRHDEGTVSGTAITPDGRRAVQVYHEGFAQVWDTAECKKLGRFQLGTAVVQALPTPDGKTLVCAMKDGTLELVAIDTRRQRAVLRGHDIPPHTVLFTADSARIITGSSDDTVRVWDCDSGQLLRVLHPPSGLGGARICPKGHRMVTSSRRCAAVQLWNLDTGAIIAHLPGHESGLREIGFSPEGDRVATVTSFPGNELRLWNVATGELIRELGRHTNTVTQIAFNGDGTRIASCSMDQTIGLWDGTTGKPIAVLKGHNGQVTWVAFNPDGNQLVSGSQDHTVRLWDAVHGTPLAVLNGHTASVYPVAYTADGSQIVSASLDGTIRLWDAQLKDGNGLLRGHKSFVYSVAFHPDGERVASASWDGTVRIWEATTGQQKALLNHGANTIVTAVAFHPNGNLLATRIRGAIVLWDLSSGQELHRWHSHSDHWRDTRLAFSPRGDLLASGCQGGVVRLWDVETRAEAAVLRGHRDEVRDVAFSPDGRWLASVGDVSDRTIRIWDVATKTQVQVLTGHKDCIYAVAFSPDGTRLASSSVDGTARLWDPATWTEITTLKHGTNVYGLAFTPDGTRLACACADNSIRFWDVATHQSVAELRGHGNYVHALAFSPDGTRLASASGDCLVRIWDTMRPQNRARGRQGQ